MGEERPRIGVLAIQGDFAAHAQALEDAGADAVEVRKPSELDGLDGLVLPGGESTTFLKFLERDGLLDSLQRFLAEKPAFGTCAGCILLARNVTHPPQAKPGADGHQRRAECLWTADRQRHPNRSHQAARRPSGDGLHPRPAHCQCGPRRGSDGRTGRVSRAGTPRQVTGGNVPP